MASENLRHWEALKRPPEEALKRIDAGRLRGKTDISPQWRLKAVTEQFGPVGFGWKDEIVNMWIEKGEGEILAFCHINFYYKDGGEWSAPIPGIGGSMLTAKEKSGPHNSDECFKMAYTDALSVAMKKIGVAADIYMGLFDGTKYKVQMDYTTELADIARAATLDELKQVWEAVYKIHGNVPELEKAKNKRKGELV